jgi:adenylosuccinate lyase
VVLERICGLARLVRGSAVAALENVALWHERDISHSSAERVIGPDATILLDFMLDRFTGLVENLVVYETRMADNIKMTHGVIFSQMLLLALIKSGMTREDAYAVVQDNAMKAWQNGTSFKDLLLADSKVMSCINPQEVEEIFQVRNFLRHINFIFKRIFGDDV